MFFRKKIEKGGEHKKMDMLEFGEKLKDLRKSRDISQEDLGYIIGVSRATIGSWESGRRNISIKHLERVCAYFKLDITYFSDETTKDEIIDLLERAKILYNSEKLPLAEKQILHDELVKLYLKMKG